MDKELENRINDTASPLKIELNGEIRLTPQRDNSFIIGKTYVKSLIEITRPGAAQSIPTADEVENAQLPDPTAG